AAELSAVRRKHHLTWRDFISEVAWLPFGEAGPLLEIIDVTYLDKVYSEALSELFAAATDAERTRFVKHCFAAHFPVFPPPSEDLVGLEMEFTGSSMVGQYLPG